MRIVKFKDSLYRLTNFNFSRLLVKVYFKNDTEEMIKELGHVIEKEVFDATHLDHEMADKLLNEDREQEV